jgi:undecaprenyl-diphosphatase
VLTYFQAIVIGLLQGVTELFPVSSLGHSVLLPALLSGSWEKLARAQSQSESFYLSCRPARGDGDRPPRLLP